MKFGEFPLIDLEALTDFSMLKDHVLYSDEFEDAPKEVQQKIYNYCKSHGNIKCCRENLQQIRYAVARIYFGW